MDPNPTNPPTDPPDPSTCAEAHIDLAGVIPTVMLVVDQSGSMKEDFGGQSRWDAVYNTLMASSGVVKQREDQVRFGLTTYTGVPGGACPQLAKVAPAVTNYGAIDGVLSANAPATDTPTGESIQAIIPELEAIQEPGPKVIVLATDGLPDTCAIPNPANDAERRVAQDLAVSAVTAAQTAGIDTYVISVGPDVSQAHLQDLANAGVGLAVGGADNATYYQALDAASLVTAFDDIINGVRACNFALDKAIDPSYADSGTVTLDGVELEQGVDWQLLDDGQTVELLGQACDTVLDGDHTLEAEFTCDTGGPIVL